MLILMIIFDTFCATLLILLFNIITDNKNANNIVVMLYKKNIYNTLYLI